MEHLAKILLDLFLMFGAAKIMGEIFERAKQPAVIGEIIAGIILGPYILGWVYPSVNYDFMAEIGVIILLFHVGLQTGVDEMMEAGKVSLLVAVGGVILPFVFGYLYAVLIGHQTIEAMFIGAAMVATSVGITARVFADLNILDAKISRIVLGAAVFDDIIGLIILGIVTGLGKGSISYLKIGIITLEAVGFVIFLIILSKRVVPLVIPKISALKSRNAPFVLAILFCLGMSFVATEIELAAIVGAFMAGMVLSGFNVELKLSLKVESLNDFLVPFFFVVMGMKVDLSVFGETSIVGAALILTMFAILGKLLGCGVGAIKSGRRSAVLVGLSMVPRGEVGMIVAAIGLRMGAIAGDLYSVVIFMVVVTTLIAPPILRKLLSNPKWREEAEPPKEIEPE